MSRVPLDKISLKVGSGERLVLTDEQTIYVYYAGTTDEAIGYTTEEGSTLVTYPLEPNSEGKYDAWFPEGEYDLYSEESETTTRWNASVGSIPSIIEYELPQSEPYYLTSPQLVPIKSGLFTPSSDKVKIRIEMGMAVSGIGKATSSLYIGPPDSVTVNYGLPQLTPDKEYNVGGEPAEGVHEYALPALTAHMMPFPELDYVLPSPTAHFSKELILEDLVPGQEYKWEVSSAVVGGADGVSMPDISSGAGKFDFSIAPGAAGFTRLLVHCPGDARARIYLMGQTPDNTGIHKIFDKSVAAGSNCWVAVNKQGNIGLITNQDADATAAIQVVNMWNGDITPLAIKVGASDATAVHINPVSTKAYVCATGSAKLLRFDLTSFSWDSTEFTVGTTPIDVQVSPNGLGIAVACYGSGGGTGSVLSMINVASGVVENFTPPTGYGSRTLMAVAWQPDSLFVWCLFWGAGGSYLVPFDAVNETWDTDRAINLGTDLVGFPSFQPDGKNLFLFYGPGSSQVRQYTIHEDRPPTQYLTWPTGGVLSFGKCGPNGQICATAQNSNGSFDGYMHWHGVRARIRNEGVGEFFKVAIQGAE